MSKKVALFLVEKFEEIEAVTPLDVLRRAGCEVTAVSLEAQLPVTGNHGITVVADKLFAEVNFDEYDALYFPGGYMDLSKYDVAMPLAQQFKAEGKLVAAICAAPTQLVKFGIYEGLEATCYPEMKGEFEPHNVPHKMQHVVEQGNVITGRAPGASMELALALAAYLAGPETAQALREGMYVDA